MTVPRKCRLDLATPPEVAIREALRAVEAMPADVRLTTASMHIQSALDCVGFYVDEQMRNVDIGAVVKITVPTELTDRSTGDVPR